MYVENTYILLKEIKSLSDLDDIKELYNNNLFVNNEGQFIDVQSSFDSIYNLGKLLYNEINIKNLSDLYFEKMSNIKYKDNIIKLLFDWIKLNGHPYSHFYIRDNFDGDDYLPEDTLMLFAYDCIFLYLAYEIIALFNTLKKIMDKDGFIDFNFLDELQEKINFLDFEEIFKGHKKGYGIWQDVIEMDFENFNILDNIDELLEDIKLIDSLIDDESAENLDTCCFGINNLLVIVMAHTTNLRKWDFLITSQRPFYNGSMNSYSLIETCQSIMGVAYSHLFLVITSNVQYAHRCQNPNCSNIITNNVKRDYCECKSCSSYRNNKKSHKYNNRHNKN